MDPLESGCGVKVELVFLNAEDSKFRVLEVHVESVGDSEDGVLHLLQGDNVAELLYHTYSSAGKHLRCLNI